MQKEEILIVTEETINSLFLNTEKLIEYKNNCIKASTTLNWNNEKLKLLDIYSNLFSTSN